LLILLEGPDGGGKTTLAAALRAAWDGPFTLIHTGPPDPPDRCVYQEYEQQLDELAERCTGWCELIVLDRWHLGDPIYARYRADPTPRASPGGVLHIDMAVSALGAVKVMCLPPFSVVLRRVLRDGDWFIDVADLPRIYGEYAAAAALYNYGIPDWELDPAVVAKSLIGKARNCALLASHLSGPSDGTYTGALLPGVIFAGDELGGQTEKGTRLGFVRPFTPKLPGSCSEWLMSALLAAGGDIMNTCGLVNANDPGVDLAELARIRPGARWVALGKRASAALAEARIEHREAHHPQWARRFRHSDHAGYVNELRRVTGTEQ
jgi:hypothetical protein